ncbi:MAG: TonB family protein [Thermoanaerobaculia bacterium]|nr:TonB family protein [Thermoanaerobaculia bacterium]
MTETNAAVRRPAKAGMLVILLLGMVFMLILAGLLTLGGSRPARVEVRSRNYYVIAPKLRIRTEPQARAPVLATIEREAKVEIVEESGVWVKIKTADAVVGWTERSYIAGQKEYERRMARARAISELPALEGFVTERTALYAGPGFFYPVVGQLSTQAEVKVYTRDHEFYAVDYAGTIAYAEVDAIDLAPQAQEELEISFQGTLPEVAATATVAPPPSETAPAEQTPMSGWTPQTVAPDPIGVYPAVPPGGTQPQVVSRVNPSYPRSARDNGIEGVVVIRAIVRKDGKVDEAEIMRDLPWGLGDAARAAVQKWRFLPATYQGEPIDVYYTVTVRFRLSDSR